MTLKVVGSAALDGKTVSVNGHPALNVHGSDHAIDNIGPHEGGPLGGGRALRPHRQLGPAHAYESH